MTPAARSDRWLWPLGLAAALSSMIAASLGLLWIAVRNPDPAVVSDAWLAERDLHLERAALARARVAGLDLELALQPAPGGVRVEGRVLGRDGAGDTDWRVEVSRERPAEGGLDARFELARDGDAFAGVVPLPRSGRWTLVARAARSDVRLERRIEWMATP